MTDLDLDELRRLTREATPGPWRDLTISRLYRHVVVANDGEVVCPAARANADFIIAVRNALPGLLDRIERSQAALGSCAGMLTAITGEPGISDQARRICVEIADALGVPDD